MNQKALPWWLSGKESACNAGAVGSIPGSGRSSGEGNGNPLQCSCLGNSADRGAWRATVHGVPWKKVRHDLATKQQQMNQNDNIGSYLYLSSYLWWCLFFLIASSYYLMCLRSPPRASFSISFKAGLLVVNFLSCCLSGNILISPFFLKDSLLGKEILVERCFSFQLFILKKKIVYLAASDLPC